MKTHGIDFTVEYAFHGSSESVVSWYRAVRKRRDHPQRSHFIALSIPPGGSDGILLGCKDALKPIPSLHHRSERKSVNRMVRCEPRDLLSLPSEPFRRRRCISVPLACLPPIHPNPLPVEGRTPSSHGDVQFRAIAGK